MPPKRFPITPPIDPATHANDGRSEEEDDAEFPAGCFAHSATTASFATSTIEAPRFPRRRLMVIVKKEMLEGGRDAMENHDTACKNAAKHHHDRI